MTKTITIRIKNTGENLEAVIRSLIKSYKEEVDSFSITDE